MNPLGDGRRTVSMADALFMVGATTTTVPHDALADLVKFTDPVQVAVIGRGVSPAHPAAPEVVSTWVAAPDIWGVAVGELEGHLKQSKSGAYDTYAYIRDLVRREATGRPRPGC